MQKDISIKSNEYSEFHTIHGVSSLKAGFAVNQVDRTKTISLEAHEKPGGEPSQKPTPFY